MRTVIFLILLLNSFHFYSQTIRGKVMDSSGDVLVGAYVSHPRSGHHEHTDIKGEFVLEGVAIGDSLLFSFVGFETERLTIQGFTEPLTIELDLKVNLLSEIQIRPKAELSDLINELDLITRPINNSQLILRKVPGLFIAQHAGGGKAEQIFLRGFDIDHGTDVSIDVNGLPVNMVSHAHGQGYADMHFVIAETLERLDFNKGGYQADQGNFSTAGSISLRTKDRIDRSTLRLEGGQFDTQRVMSMIKLSDKLRHGGYVAFEHHTSNGPFDSPQDLKRTNIQLHYDFQLDNKNEVDFYLGHFSSRWDASGQIPQRAIDSGLIDRWGAIDDTEGGETGREDISVSLKTDINKKWSLTNTASATNYDFNLFSNFTFFLVEPESSDQIQQQESRTMYNWNSEAFYRGSTADWEHELNLGINWRYDEIDGSSLSRTVGRDSLLRRLSYADLQESNQSAYAEWCWSKGRVNITPGIRVDRFEFIERDRIDIPVVKESRTVEILSPKLRMNYIRSDRLKYYLHLGRSFHSNDIRMIMDRGTTNSSLPASTGADLGIVWKPNPNVFLQVAAWYLHLEQEFVYVGDEAIVEPSGETERSGLDLSTRILLGESWVIDFDGTYAYARSIDEEESSDRIPLAPEWTASGGITYSSMKGWSGSLYSRYLGDRPANEDYSFTAEGYLLFDLDISYAWNRLRIFLRAENITDVEWEEAQFLTRSRLSGEPEEGVEEMHFTPGTPRAIYGGISISF